MRSLLRSTYICLVAVSSFLLSTKAEAQLQILTPDTSLCPGTQGTLNAVVLGGTPNLASFPSSDDVYSTAVPIGFTFNYFGTNYTQCLISLNGYIKFDLTQAGNYSPWAIGQGIPGNNNVLNSIMGFYSDIYPLFPTNPGTIDYTTIGTAPNRKFVVSFCDAPMFSCTNLVASFQIVLYETTNDIEVHIANAPNCPSWNGGYAIEGIQNATGTVAYPVPGRNYPTQWSAFQSSHRWTPTGPGTYSLTPIPYAPVPSSGAIINWFANGVTPIGTGTSITVSPNVNTYYVAEVTRCQDTVRDTVYVTIGGGATISNTNPNPGQPGWPDPKGDPTTCGGTDGFITLYGLDPNFAYTVKYQKNGVQVNQFPVTSTVNGVINLVNLGAGTYDSIIVYKGVCYSNPIGPIVLIDPPVDADWTYTLKKGCEADTVEFHNSSIQNTFNIWDFGDGTGDTVANPTHIFPIQGVYIVRLFVNNGVCYDSLTQQVNTMHPLVADFTVDDANACANQLLTFTNNSTATNPSYFYDFGNGDTSIMVNPTYVYTEPGTYTVMMVATDDIPCSDTAYITVTVDSIPTVTFTTSDDVLCEGQGITFLGEYTQVGNTGVQWNFGDGNGMPDVDQVTHAYDSSGTYTVELTATYANCPDVSFTKDINIRAFPTIDIGRDTSICPNGQAVVIGDAKNQSTAGALWTWSTGETTPMIAVRHPGIYTARIEMDGCVADDSLEVFKDCYLDIPNSFTPNNDGINDYFLPRQLLSKGVTAFKMTVFNRWGQVIFETNRIDGRGWDGKFNDKDQPTGAYVYIIDATLKNGAVEHYQGNVTLLR